MALYPEHLIREVGQSNDIVDIASTYTKLKRSGGSMVGLCPFHREKTPSFHISPEEQLFYCFGCGQGGTIFDFVMRAENLDFVDTVKYLADRAGISLPDQEDNLRQAETFSIKQKILKMNILSAKFFYENLKSDEALVARRYIAHRGLTPETVNKFGIGYALSSWDKLTGFLKENGFTEEEIVVAGLAVKNANNRVYDKFRGRLMFPIIDVRGNVIAFGGRVLGGEMPKYMNSPDTNLFNKSFNLFALNFAKGESKDNGVILAEGYMDVISMHQSGITNSVATLGTSLTNEQAKLIKKYSKEVIICYDSDNAGIAATIRAGEILISCGNKVKVITVVGAKDPDEFIKNKGVERFKTLIEKAKPYYIYRIDKIKEKYDLSDIESKVAFTNEASEVLSMIDNNIERDAYIKELSYQTGISIEAISSQVKKLLYQNNKKEQTKETREIKKQILNGTDTKRDKNEFAVGSGNRLERSEKMLIGLMAKNKNVFKLACESILLDSFSNSILNRAAQVINEGYESREKLDSYIILSKFSSSDVSYVTSILYQETGFDNPIKAAEELIRAILNERDKLKAKSLMEEGNIEELNKLLQKKKRI